MFGSIVLALVILLSPINASVGSAYRGQLVPPPAIHVSHAHHHHLPNPCVTGTPVPVLGAPGITQCITPQF
jgi:hypothetical protein